MGEEELRGVDTKPLVGHLAAWNYFMSIKNPATRVHQEVPRWAKKKKLPNAGQAVVTNDPMEATYIGIHMWAQAVEKAKSTDVDKVIAAMAGQTFKAPGRASPEDGREEPPPAKPVFIGEMKRRRPVQRGLEDPRPGQGQPWSPFIPGNDKKKDEPEKMVGGASAPPGVFPAACVALRHQRISGGRAVDNGFPP